MSMFGDGRTTESGDSSSCDQKDEESDEEGEQSTEQEEEREEASDHDDEARVTPRATLCISRLLTERCAVKAA